MSSADSPVIAAAQAGVRWARWASTAGEKPGQVGAVGEALGEQHVHHGAGQRAVGAGPRRQVQVGLGGGRGAVGVDHHQRHVAAAAGLLHPVHEVHLGVHRVAAPHHDQLRVAHLARVDAALGADAGEPAGIGEGEAEGFTLARPAGQVAEAADGAALHQAHGAGVVVGPDGLGAVAVHRLAQPRGQQVEGLVPADGREAALALGADPQQRPGEALRVVGALGVAGHLGADHPVGVGLLAAPHAADAALGGDLDLEGAHAGAVVGADAGAERSGHAADPAMKWKVCLLSRRRGVPAQAPSAWPGAGAAGLRASLFAPAPGATGCSCPTTEADVYSLNNLAALPYSTLSSTASLKPSCRKSSML
jgi:hypothetical protein